MIKLTRVLWVVIFAGAFFCAGREGCADNEAAQLESPAYNKEGTVSMDFENAELKNVLKAFSVQTGINFIASDIIEEKRVTLFLSNVSIESALVSILDANGLLYEKYGSNIYLIKPTGKGNIKTVTRVFRLNYISVYKMSGGPTSGSSSSNINIIGQPAIAEAGSVSSTAANSPQAPAASAGDSGPKSIIDILGSLISKYGRIVADRRSNCLIITDIPDVFESIEETIKRLDVEPAQVMIEAELIETTTDALKRLGIEWGSTSQLAKVTYTGSSSVSGGSSTSSNPTFPTPFPLTENFIKDVYRTNLGASGLFSYGTLRIADTEIVLKLLATDSDTKRLARPRILTVNNEPAVIKVSANTAIGTNNTSVAQTGQNISTAERAETGVILKVTPQVNEKGDIFMLIEPSVSRVVTSTLNSNFQDPNYRQSQNLVMVKDGDTVVIAGLIQTDITKANRKVPLVGDLPIIGELFKSVSNQKTETELLIFVTPHIVKKRDAEIVSSGENGERAYMIQKTFEKHELTGTPAQKKSAGPPGGVGTGDAVGVKRDFYIDSAIRKYSR